MHRSLRWMSLGLLFASSLAAAGGTGLYYEKGKKTVLVSAYAYRAEDPFEKGKQITAVVFADKPIDAAALKNATDRGDALDDQLREIDATRVTLNIEADGSVQNVNVNAPGYSTSQSGSGWYALDLKRNDAQRIEGSFHTKDESDKKDARYYDLTFALDLPGAADPGAALPAGGGEPAKVYASYLAALNKGDVDQLARLMTKERADQILAHRKDPDFKMMFAFIQSQALHDPKYVKGNVGGDSATLVYTGKGDDGSSATSTVTMRKEGNAWKLDKESMSSKLN